MNSENYLSKFGYVLFKDNFSEKELLEIKHELKARPLQEGNFPFKEYNVYIETKNKLYIPKMYGIKKFGKVKCSKNYLGEFFSDNIEFNGSLFPEQQKPAEILLNNCKENGGGILQLGTGFGKCLGKETNLILSTGNIVNIQDLKINDKLIGDDLKPRIVKSIIHGYDIMYSITNLNTQQQIYRANSDHILCLSFNNNYCFQKKYINNKMNWVFTGYDFDNKKFNEYITQSLLKICRLIRFYHTKKLNIIELSIREYLKLPEYVKNNLYGYKININSIFNFEYKNAYNYGKTINLLKSNLDQKLLFSNNTSKLQFLKGLIHNDTSNINKLLLHYILFICNSLCIDYILTEHGIKIKNLHSRKYLLYSLNIKYDKIDCFYGFELSDNKRFLLHDMSVTHNTVTVLYVLSKLKGKTIVVVNKIPLLNQWKNEISQFLPNAKIGILQGSKNIDVNNCDIIVSMLQSLSSIDYPVELFSDIKTCIFDEVHNISTRSFSKVLFKLTSLYTIGLSATPERSDGCEYVFKWHIGDIVSKDKLERKGLNPLIHVVKISSDTYKEITNISKLTGKSQLQFTTMLSDLISMDKRNKLIIEIILQVIKPTRKILVLSDRRSHLQTLFDLLTSKNVSFTFGIFVGGMKEKDMSISRSCQVILATFSVFKEGVSEKDLNTLILTTPKKYIGHLSNTIKNENGNLEQIVGRIFRKEHTIEAPLIIDLFDNFSVYKSHFNGRKAFYTTHFKSSEINIFNINLNNSFENLFKYKENKKLIKNNQNQNISPITTFLIDENL